MIIVTGTRRAGTSVWMQILQQGGFQVLGDKFPANWQNLVEDANPNGFYESTLVQGINYHTNPDPRSGSWLPPDKVTNIAVKIFADGLVKTDFAYLTNVIYTLRPWREVDASQERMNSIRSNAGGSARIDENEERLNRLPAGFAWWKANFSLVRDMNIRRYPVVVFSYQALLDDPESIIGTAFGWLGAGDSVAAASVVDPSLRTQNTPTERSADHDYAEVFDELYDTLCVEQEITPKFYQKLVDIDDKISQDIRAILS